MRDFYPTILPFSSTAEQEAVNFKVTGSNPVGAARTENSNSVVSIQKVTGT